MEALLTNPIPLISSFPKIFAVGTDYIRDLFLEEVEVTEEIDGSQFSFGKIEGEFFMRSKGAQLFPEAPAGMFKKAVEYVEDIKDRLPDNTAFYCEYLNNPKHNILSYSRVPKTT